MSVRCTTGVPLDAEVYDSLNYSLDLKKGTVDWETKAPTGLAGVVNIDYGRATGRWWEEQGFGVLDTAKYENHTFFQPSQNRKAARAVILMDRTQNEKDDRSGFKKKAGTALVSEWFDPATAKPVDLASYEPTAASRSRQTSAVNSTQKDTGSSLEPSPKPSLAPSELED